MKKATAYGAVILILVFSSINALVAGIQQAENCAICGMEIKKDAKIIFESTKDGKPVHFCSYSCVHGLHGKFKDAPVFVYDFNTGARLDAKTAFFLVKSKNILKEIEFGMPPAVVAFTDEASARKVQSRLKDGEVVKGYEAVTKIYP